MGRMSDRPKPGDPTLSADNSTPWEAPKPYGFGPDEWKPIAAEHRFSIAEKRLEAFTYILNSDLACLALLSMSPDPQVQTTLEISSKVNTLLQKQESEDGEVGHVMENVLARVGAVAKADENQGWQLTPFGAAIRPAIVYAREACSLIEAKPSEVFGNWTPATDENGDIITTLNARRIATFLAICRTITNTGAEKVDFESVREEIWTMVDERESPAEEDTFVEVEETVVLDNIGTSQLETLAASGLLVVETVETPKIEFVKYEMSADDPQKTPRQWPEKMPSSVNELWQWIQKAAEDISKQNKSFDTQDIFQKMKANGLAVLDLSLISNILAQMERQKILIKSAVQPAGRKRPLVSLTPLGRNAHDLISKPLYMWFMYPDRVPAINRATESYTKNAGGYRALIGQIAADYAANSPVKPRKQINGRKPDALREKSGAPSVYNRALWEAPKPYYFGPDGWAFVESDPRIATALKRFGALGNIINNGAKTLTLLAMDPAYGFANYRDIRDSANELAVEKVIRTSKSTLQFLAISLSSVGAAAKSTTDEEDWQITPFGNALKIGTIYAWKSLTALKLAPADVFGKNTHTLGHEGEQSETTTAANRVKLILKLAEGQTTLGEVARLLGISTASAVETMRGLRGRGIVNLRTIDSPLVERVTTYSLTENGKLNSQPWEPYKKPRKGRPSAGVYTHASKSIQDAVIALARGGETVFGAKDIVAQLAKTNVKVGDIARYGSILKHFAAFGYLRRESEFEHEAYSVISLTEKGQAVYDTVIKPLYDWFTDPALQPAVTQAAQEYQGTEGRAFYRQFIESVVDLYKAKSPGKNADHGQKMTAVLDFIVKHDGQANHKDIAEQMDLSSTLVDEVCKLLAERGLVISRPPAENSRPTLWITQQYRAQIEPEQEVTTVQRPTARKTRVA